MLFDTSSDKLVVFAVLCVSVAAPYISMQRTYGILVTSALSYALDWEV